ncbi:hypothetical protein Vadar_026324 [Vaccinium darrowii]|uniref:Uncharacterized protein n=1 Tax=Vaccinium darrowii TaxID=229202 RepID=A0ACB7ZGI8_9ERIC|nr:hypothetical protein Vadar_026324 [Vaccinium darrowii]
MGPVALCILALVVVCITHWVSRWRNPRCSGQLPPGSMGLPLVGETIQFFTPTTSSDIPPFIKNRIDRMFLYNMFETTICYSILRYGPVFRTNLVGQSIIITTDPEFSYFVFQEEGKLFQSWYPDTFVEILGKQNMGALHGILHKCLKNMALNLFGPESLKKMLPEVEQAACRNLKRWSSQESVELKEASATGRKQAVRMLKNQLQGRREKPSQEQRDFFDYVLEELERADTILTEEIALDLMFGLLFASYKTTSLAITMATKFLLENPLALKELTVEHEEILRRRENSDSGFTWKEYKSMKFTFQLINETVRMANIAPGIFRKTVEDVKFQGYTIPAGWFVMVCPPAVHMNPANYKDPLQFNPKRWENDNMQGMELTGASKHFMAFGGGMRFCLGADFAKVQMAVFLHCLVTKYRWKAIKGGAIVRTPALTFPNGFHVQFSGKNEFKQD